MERYAWVRGCSPSPSSLAAQESHQPNIPTALPAFVVPAATQHHPRALDLADRPRCDFSTNSPRPLNLWGYTYPFYPIMYNIMIYKTRLYHTLTPHNQETPWFTINHWNSPRRIPLKLGARLHRNGSLRQTGSRSARPCWSLATDGKHEDVSYPRLWSACGQHTALPFGKVPKIRKRETNKGKTSVSLTCTLKGMNWMNWSLKTFNFDGRVITCLY